MRLPGVVWLSLKRNRLRTGLTILGVASTVVGFLLLRTASEAWSARSTLARENVLLTINGLALFQPMPRTHVDVIRNTTTLIEHVTYSTYTNVHLPGDEKTTFGLDAVSDEHFALSRDRLVDPAVFTAWKNEPQGVIVGEKSLKQLGVKTGETITVIAPAPIGELSLVVVGSYSVTSEAARSTNLVVHFDDFDRRRPESERGTVKFIESKLKNVGDAARVAHDIDAAFDATAVPTLTATEKAITKGGDSTMSSFFVGLDMLSGIVLLLMSLVIANTIGMTVAERTTEYAVLRALGFEPIDLSIMVLGESLLVTGLGALTGLAVAIPTLTAFGTFLSENAGKVFPTFKVSSTSVVAVVLLSTFLSVLATLLPALRAARTPVANALRRS